MRFILYPAIAALALLASCKSNNPGSAEQPTPDKDPLVLNMDSTLNPGDDFFLYACGSWLKKNPIPGTEKGWGIWSMVQDETYNRMRGICESAAKAKAANGTLEQKIGDFYASGMDTVAIDKQGVKSIQPELDRIDAISNKQDLLNVIALHQTYGVAPLFGMYIFQDEKKSDQQALHIYQGGIGLPDRDYYFNTDARTVNIRKEYVAHLTKMMSLLGADSVSASKQAAAIMNIETGLAKASRKLEDLRDPYLNYNKMTPVDMKSLTPGVEWNGFLTAMHIPVVDSLIVGQPEFFREMEKSLNKYPIDQWKSYLKWHFTSSFASYMSSDFEKEHFNFFGTVLSGVKAQRPRWKRVLDTEEGAIGDLLGQLYVKQYVAPSVRERYQKLTNNIIEAYRERIGQLSWMNDSTKQKALLKLNSITTKVGYPDKWKDYSKYSVTRDSYVLNVMNANVWQHDYMISKLGKPVDRTEWDMTPQTYNAYYNPSNNEIVLPAAIFIIPGLADSDADDAIIYGYAGASTIGHEITHGFDDQGRQFDEKGNLTNWWTPSDEKEFANRAEKIIRQFNDFVVLDSMHINGTATQGENIADLGGVVLGYEAFKKTEQYKSGKKINGLTPDQRYFLGYALSWLGHFRDETVAMRVMTDVHSPNNLRINGPLANIPEFHKAFNVKEGQYMYRADSLRVNIW